MISQTMILISSVHFSELLLFVVIQTATSPLKKFIQPSDIAGATGPFAPDRLYVDKTHLAQTLCEHDGGQYFFVRPRWFGKSSVRDFRWP